jgi:Zn-dependent protease with chaperone function
MFKILVYDGLSAKAHEGDLQLLGKGHISINSPSFGSKIFKLNDLEVSLSHGRATLMSGDLQVEMSEDDFKKLGWKKDHTAEFNVVFKMALIAFSILLSLYIFRTPLKALVSQHLVDPMLASAGDQLKAYFKPLNCMSPQQKKVLQSLFLRMNKNVDEYHLIIQESHEVNAFAMPGNMIVMNSALLEKSPSPEALSGVLAHEISHLELKHLNAKVMKDFAIQFAFSVVLHQIKNTAIIQQLTKGYFSQSEEAEADQSAARILKENKIDPKGMVAFFEALKKQQGDFAAFGLSHPGYESRIRTFSGKYESRNVLSPADWSVIKAGCGPK